MSNVIIVTAPTEAARKAEAKLEAALARATTPLPPVVFAVGGDGTMLSAIRQHWASAATFVGISAGHLGFLQSFEIDQVDEIIKALESQNLDVVRAPLLEAVGADGRILGHAFNDISAERAGARASRMHVDVDGSTGSFIGDGVIFATAFGSTAYSLSAGGPIVDTRVSDVFVVTPNNPHVSAQYSSLQRPHVLGRGRRVQLTLSAEDAAERPSKLVLDGETAVPEMREPVVIRLSDETVAFLQLEADSFHRRLEAKRLGRS